MSFVLLSAFPWSVLVLLRALILGLAALCDRGKGIPDVVSMEREVTQPGADAKSPAALGIVWE